ncbi:GNAT family N-acetyltransferase [Rhodococcus triatomae]|uniref:Acetyltransferase (GNAT) family protein n=1 Tax=Rhodococcus triatomae TaxID=300028 RepID=A0A1G8DG36_9NOCA|nr:GNAT family N-acetyltransferase [Rhodococcus triatomae]QNG18438.1 GNAT family N-acetyltransferase [Rhodococcus triatomae]QNG21892.1 GNAT family N-acetyltransferase [Rhodococcus triatomae]SDH56642.1 Acetyltransferase (GNAT) family protein [Rhodococcus triatomae]
MSYSFRIRPATSRDAAVAAQTLGRAFADYPFTRHTVDARDHQDRVLALQRLFLAEIGLRCGKVWVSDDVAAVAVWTTPLSTGLDAAFGEIAEQVTDLYGDRADVAARADEATAHLRPTDPVWYLATVGVAPTSQGRGLGRAVLEPELAAAEDHGRAAYLETSSPANVAFYERLGFEVTGSVSLPDDGPKVWAMVRRPRTAAGRVS